MNNRRLTRERREGDLDGAFVRPYPGHRPVFLCEECRLATSKPFRYAGRFFYSPYLCMPMMKGGKGRVMGKTFFEAGVLRRGGKLAGRMLTAAVVAGLMWGLSHINHVRQLFSCTKKASTLAKGRRQV